MRLSPASPQSVDPGHLISIPPPRGRPQGPRCPRCRAPMSKHYLNAYGGPYVYQWRCQCGHREYGGYDMEREGKK